MLAHIVFGITALMGALNIFWALKIGFGNSMDKLFDNQTEYTGGIVDDS